MNISTYLADIGARLGVSGASPIVKPGEGVGTRLITYMDIQSVPRPHSKPQIYTIIGYVDGYEIFASPHNQWETVASHSDSGNGGIACMQILHTKSSPRNLAIVYQSNLTAVRFIDLQSHDTYHIVRTIAPVVAIRANEYVVALLLGDGSIRFHSNETLEEVSITDDHGKISILALGDRWAAFNEQRSASTGLVSSWTTAAASMSQDAFDNIVMAVSGGTSSSTSITGSPTTRKFLSVITIYDVVIGQVIGTIDQGGEKNLHDIEQLEFSPCGTRLFASCGNGHFVNVYQVDNVTAGAVSFRLVHVLNRGLTPARITCISSHANIAAVCSSRGTIHLFSLMSGESTITASCRIRPEGVDGEGRDFPILKFSPLNREIFLLHHSGVIETYSVSSDCTCVDLVSTVSIISEGRPEEKVLCVAAGNTRARADGKIDFETCDPLPVPVWMSPMLRDNKENPNPPIEGILDALGKNAFAEETEGRFKFIETNGKDEFVQIVVNS